MLDILSGWWNRNTPRDHVVGFYKAMLPIHKSLCDKWYANIAMQSGGAGQWLEQDDATSTLKAKSAPHWRKRGTYNEILPLSVTQRQKLMPKNPNINVRPANMLSEEDRGVADLARLYCRAKWKQVKFQETLEEMTLGMVPCTVGYLMTVWDGKEGIEISKGVYTGRATIEYGNPFEIIPDFSVSRFSEMPRFVRAKVRSLDYILHRWGKKVKAQELDPNSMVQLKAQALISGTRGEVQKLLKDHAVVLDMYELPSHKYPNGFHHTCTEDMDLITQQDLSPYYVDRGNGKKDYFLPIDAAQMTRLFNVLIGTNSVEQATGPQCFYNEGMSTIQQNTTRLGRTKIFAAVGSIAKGAMIEDPAEVIVEWDPDQGPTPTGFKPPEMAQYHLNHIHSQPAKIQNAFGIHDATQGVLPRRATSGKAIGFLMEKDDERHIDPRREIDRAVSSAYTKMLNIQANAGGEEEVKDLIGDDGAIVKQTINGSQFRAVDVTVTRDTSLPETAAGRMELGMELLGKNATREQLEIVFAIMKATDIEDLEAILKGNSMAEEIYVRMENFDMRKGLLRPPSMGENHTLHIKGHEKLLKDPTLPQQVKMGIMEHIQTHQQLQGEEAASAVQPPQEIEPELAGPPGGEEITG